MATAFPSPDSPAAPLAASSPEATTLAGRTVVRIADGAEVDAASLVPVSGTQLLLFLTHTADFDSFEQAMQLVDVLPALAAAGVGATFFVLGACWWLQRTSVRAMVVFVVCQRVCRHKGWR